MLLEKKIVSCSVCGEAREVPHPYSNADLAGFTVCNTCNARVCEKCSIAYSPEQEHGLEGNYLDLSLPCMREPNIQCQHCWRQMQNAMRSQQQAGLAATESISPRRFENYPNLQQEYHSYPPASSYPASTEKVAVVCAYVPRSSASRVFIYSSHDNEAASGGKEPHAQIPLSPYHEKPSGVIDTGENIQTSFNTVLQKTEAQSYPLYSSSTYSSSALSSHSVYKREWFYHRWIQSLAETYFSIHCRVSLVVNLVVLALAFLGKKISYLAWELMWIGVFFLRITGVCYAFLYSICKAVAERCRKGGSWRVRYERFQTLVAERIRNQNLPWWKWLIVPFMSSKGVNSTVIGRVGVEIMEAEGLLPLSSDTSLFGKKWCSGSSRGIPGDGSATEDERGVSSSEVFAGGRTRLNDWSNVFAEVAIGQHECVGMATRVVPRTTNPVWNEQFVSY